MIMLIRRLLDPPPHTHTCIYGTVHHVHVGLGINAIAFPEVLNTVVKHRVDGMTVEFCSLPHGARDTRVGEKEFFPIMSPPSM